jgi:hypothetical protein
LRPQFGAIETPDVDPAEPDDAAGRVVEPFDQREDGALPRARRTDEGGALAALGAEGDAVEDSVRSLSLSKGRFDRLSDRVRRG